MATYKVQGTSKENAIAQASLIIAYKADRSSPETMGEELGRATANLAGEWEITFEDWSSNVFVVCLDPTTEIKYKAKMRDWVLGALQQEPTFGQVYPILADEFYADNVALLHFDGATNQAVFTNEFGTDWTTPNSATITSSQKKFGNCALNLTGSNYIAKDVAEDWRWLHDGTTDWTIEFWKYETSAANNTFFDNMQGATAQRGVFARSEADGKITLRVGRATSGTYEMWLDTAPGVVTLNVWEHVAFVFKVGVGFAIYVNGTEVGSQAGLGAPSSSAANQNFIVGAQNSVGAYFNGYIDDFRVTKAARYLAGFFQPDAAFPDTRFVPGYEATILDPYWGNIVAHLGFTAGDLADPTGRTWSTLGSPAPVFSGGEMTLSGTAYVKSDSSSDVAFGLGDFTIEFNIDNAPGLGVNANIVDTRDGGGPGLGLYSAPSSNFLRMALGNTGNVIIGSITVRDGNRHHVALVRSSGIITLYVDGVADGTYDATAYDFTAHTAGYTFGSTSSASQPASGTYDNLRITKGVARYTGAFSPLLTIPDIEYDPNELLPVLYPLEIDPYFSDIESLRHGDGDGTDVIPGRLWTTDVATSAAQIKYGSESFYYNGTSGFSREYDDVFLDLTVPFTIEAWIYPELNTDYQVIFSIGEANNNNNRFMFYLRGGGVLYTYASDGTIRIDMGTADSPVTVDTWHHVALSSDGTTVFMHLNGNLVQSGAWSGQPYTPAENNFRWGVGWLNANHRYFKGYMDEQRITLGSCRYAGENFTVPSEAFTDTRFQPGQTPTILDPYFSNNISLYHFEESVVAELQNSVPDGVDFAVYGPGPHSTSASEFQFGARSMSLTSSTHLEFYTHISSGSTYTDLGSVDATFEGFFYVNGLQDDFLFNQGGGSGAGASAGATKNRINGFQLAALTDGSVQLQAGNLTLGGATQYFAMKTATGVIPTNTWFHIAVTVENQVPRIFVDGVNQALSQVGGVTSQTTFTNIRLWNDAPFNINGKSFMDGGESGALNSANTTRSGILYADEIRVTIGVARYTANFTVTTEAFPNFEYDPLENFYVGQYPVELDPYFPYLVVLLPLDGADLATTDTDRSDKGVTVTFGGNAKLSTAVVKYNATALSLDGVNDYCEFDTNFAIDTSRDFTIETWIYPTAAGSSLAVIFHLHAGVDNNGVSFYRNATTGRLHIDNGLTAAPASGTTVIPLNDWTHVAAVKSGTNILGFVNGNLEFSFAAQSMPATLNAGAAGIFRDLTYDFTGYFSDIRITQAARYTAGFNAPTAAFPTTRFEPGKEPTILDPYFESVVSLLHFDGTDGSTTIVDATSNKSWVVDTTAQIDTAASKFGGSSLRLESGDSLSEGTAADWKFLSDGTQPYTVEAWINPDAIGGSQAIFDTGGAATADIGIWFAIEASGQLYANIAKGTPGTYGVDCSTATGVVSAGQWTHVAFVFDGANMQIYVDGVQEANVAVVGHSVSNPNTLLYLGKRSGGHFFQGYIDDVRITNSVRYTANFTPPVAAFPDFEYDPLENLALRTEVDPYFDSVVSLLHFEDGGAATSLVDAVYPSDWTLSNAAAISLVDKKFGTGSLESDGTTQAYAYIGDAALKPVGAYTMECFFMVDDLSIDRGLVYYGSTSNNAGRIQGYVQSDGALAFYGENSSATGVFVAVSSTGLVSPGTWYHVAFVNDGDIVSVYLDGANVASGTVTGAFSSSYSSLVLGHTRTGNTSRILDGKIDEFRYTLGVARYTEAFTPPVAAFPDSRYIYA